MQDLWKNSWDHVAEMYEVYVYIYISTSESHTNRLPRLIRLLLSLQLHTLQAPQTILHRVVGTNSLYPPRQQQSWAIHRYHHSQARKPYEPAQEQPHAGFIEWTRRANLDMADLRNYRSKWLYVICLYCTYMSWRGIPIAQGLCVVVGRWGRRGRRGGWVGVQWGWWCGLG